MSNLLGFYGIFKGAGHRRLAHYRIKMNRPVFSGRNNETTHAPKIGNSVFSRKDVDKLRTGGAEACLLNQLT
jgi:hypothetical protein